MKTTRFALIVLLLAFAASITHAAEFHVSLDGTRDFSAIQNAIDAAVDGDTIIVHPGTYYENIEFEGKNIVLRSTSPEDFAVVLDTVIDGGAKDTVVKFAGTEDESCVLSGLTITNGKGTYWDLAVGLDKNTSAGGILGAGPYFSHLKARASISHCVITGNRASQGCGGALYGCDGEITECLICDNFADWGGGVYSCDGSIQNCVISGNGATGSGGGLYSCDGLIVNCTIADNESSYGGGGLGACCGSIVSCVITGNTTYNYGGALYSCHGVIDGCTITGNEAQSWLTDGGEALAYCNADIRNCIIWGNGETSEKEIQEGHLPTHCCIRGWTGGGKGNIFVDPLFVAPENGDYHLEAGSPCINAGYNWSEHSQKDMDGLPRIINGTVDMGAYEFVRGCYVLLDVDRRAYLATDTMTVSVGAGNLGPDEMVDLYAAVQVPGGQLLFLPSLSPEWSPWLSGWLPAGSFFQGVDRFSCSFSGAEPDGTYVIYAQLFRHGAWPPEQLSDLALCKIGYRAAPTAEYHVKQDGTGDFTTIQDAIFELFDGDTLIVHPGLYCEKIRMRGKNLIIRSMDPSDPEVVAHTVLTLAAETMHEYVIAFAGTENESCQILGFTIRASSDYCYGILGGSWYGPYARGKIANCVISGFYSPGIRIFNGTIADCVISGNSAGIWACNGEIRDCAVIGNSDSGIGHCDGTISNCLVSGNSAVLDGGGLTECNAVIQNCTVIGNSSNHSGGGLFGCSGQIVNCIVWDNSAPQEAQLSQSSVPSHSCIQNWTGGGAGNISDNPLFAIGPLGDYCLSSRAAGQPADSPCIDAGFGIPADYGLAGYTTRTDGVADTGVVDMGFHYPLQ